MRINPFKNDKPALRFTNDDDVDTASEDNAKHSMASHAESRASDDYVLKGGYFGWIRWI